MTKSTIISVIKEGKNLLEKITKVTDYETTEVLFSLKDDLITMLKNITDGYNVENTIVSLYGFNGTYGKTINSLYDSCIITENAVKTLKDDTNV